jgi:methyl-accepting chemotaxis protein
MVVNGAYNIIYMNKSLCKMLHLAQNDIRRDLPGFDADLLMGTNIEALYKSDGQCTLLDKLKSTDKAEILIGGRTLTIQTNPIIVKSGKSIGTVIEWVDRTLEVSIEEEVQGIVDAARSGDLTQRLDLHNKNNFFANLGQGINDLVDVSERIIGDTIKVMSAVAQGDLSKHIEADYLGSFAQLKADTNDTVNKLTEIIGHVKRSSSLVLRGADEIQQGNSSLSGRTEEQASSLEETASSMEQMTATVKLNADNARQANLLGEGARDQAQKGGLVVSKAVQSMIEINESSKKISDIIGVIDEIAFQTNLLALNAAVEAARAGEQGRGFAVVASEVRNLAQRSATAAKEIKDLINDSVGKVEEGSNLVNESGETLEEIVKAVQKVSEIVADISSASQEQADGIEQVNKAIMQMDQMTQQNAAMVEEATASSETVSKQAYELNQTVGFFNTGNEPQQAIEPHTERRSSERPWSAKSGSSQSTSAPANNIAPQTEWTEF